MAGAGSFKAGKYSRRIGAEQAEPESSAFFSWTVALLLSFMNHDSSSSRRTTEHIRQLSAGLRPGTKLPSTRSLVAELSVSPVTVQSAVQNLVSEGLIETRPGSGNFVAVQRPKGKSDFSWQTTALGPAHRTSQFGSIMSSLPDGAIALHTGYPTSELVPLRLLRAAFIRSSRSDAIEVRPPAAGLPELRRWFASELAAGSRRGGPAPDKNDVVITPGGQSALSSIFRALTSRGGAIVMESPTYWGAIAAARQAGLRIIPIASSGSAAPDPESLRAALNSSGAKVFYAQPHFHNPTGYQWTEAESEAVMGVMRDAGAFLVEDDWAHDFAIDSTPKPLAADDADGHVVYVRSLSKSVSPSIRVAAIIAKGPAMQRIQTDRTVDHLYVSGFLQSAALDVVTQPGWHSHNKQRIRQLRQRRDDLAALVTKYLGKETLTRIPKGGMNLWLQLPDSVDTLQLAQRCEADGLLISPGPEWFPEEPSGQFIRLNYSGPQPERYEEAIQILASAVKSLSDS